MRVGINALLLTKNEGYRQTGVSRYVERLLSALPEAMPEDDLIAYLDKAVTAPEGVSVRRTPFAIDKPAFRVAWERAAFPALARKDRLDLFHGTVNALPSGLGCPGVVTIHDLAFLRWPEQVPARRYQYLAKAVPAAAKAARRVLTVSEATKRDVVELLGVAPDKVVVTPLGVDARFAPPSTAAVEVFRERAAIRRPYVLVVGTLEPRKNLPRLLDAFALIAPRVPHQLVLIGPEGWLTGPFHEQLERLRLGDRVRLTGFVPDGDLPAWYAGADCVAVPSLYEGFGLPALEAMACGAPVVVSNVSALPEVVGDAGVLVDPNDTDSIAAGLESVLGDPAARMRMTANGRLRAAEFSWAKTAELTGTAYREAVG